MMWFILIIILIIVLLILFGIRYQQNRQWSQEWQTYQHKEAANFELENFNHGETLPIMLPENPMISHSIEQSQEQHQSEFQPASAQEISTPTHYLSHPVQADWSEQTDFTPTITPSQRETITLDDPALARVRKRNWDEVEQVQRVLSKEKKSTTFHTAPSSNTPKLETIGLNDIRESLLRQRQARTRQTTMEQAVSTYERNVIARDEVLANLAHTDSPIIRRPHRLKRVATPLPQTKNTTLNQATRPQTEIHNPPQIVRTEPVVSLPEPVHTVPTSIPEPEVFTQNFQFEPVQTVPLLHTESTWNGIREHHSTQHIDLPFMPEYDNQDEEQLIFTPDLSYQDDENHENHETENPLRWLPENHHFSEEKQEEHFPLPSLDLLLPPQYNPAAVQSDEEIIANSQIIEAKLAEFKVKVNVVDAYSGPVITRYEIEPDVGVRGSSVLNLGKDLARSLGLESIRVVETIPGKTCMGLELPNPKRQMIRLSEIFAAPQFQESPSKLTLALGQDITGQPIVTDLAKAPHLLVAGTTGSGKSVGVNAMILSMLFKCSPEDVRLIMIDPKMLELSIYEGIPHLLAPVVTDMRLAANALNWCVEEMEKRYRLMSHVRVRNIAGYNQKIEEMEKLGKKIGNPFSLSPEDPEPLQKLPYIVVIVDEFADLMMTAGKKIEELIARITQKARAAGIHLILATQRPSVDVVTGLIKANIPTRIAFQVSSKIDSRTILDQMGAENLLGQGDMLFLPPGTSYPQRVHGAFVADSEVQAVVDYLKQFGAPEYIDDILVGDDEQDDDELSDPENMGDPFDEAVAIVLKNKRTSISFLQRKMRIGYNKAADLIEQMEAEGILSEPDSSGKRTILARSSSDYAES